MRRPRPSSAAPYASLPDILVVAEAKQDDDEEEEEDEEEANPQVLHEMMLRG